jgi:hypothetical protein
MSRSSGSPVELLAPRPTSPAESIEAGSAPDEEPSAEFVADEALSERIPLRRSRASW